MSDSDRDETVTSVKLPKSVRKTTRVVSERQKEACAKNVIKARAGRVAKMEARLKGEDEEKILLRELIADKKASKQKKAEPVEADESSDDEELESEASESDDDPKETSASDSSDSEAEFVLTKRKPATKKAVAKVALIGKGKKKTAERSTMLEKMEEMAAELKALKKEKRSKVTVNINNPEKKPQSAALKQALIAL